jgi:hypothetical protein
MKKIITDEIYGAKYCKKINAKLWRFNTIPNAIKVLNDHFKPTSVIDVGCANGIHLKAFKDLGVQDLFGIEGTVHWASYIEENHGDKYKILDFREPLHPTRTYDLVLCLEVLEHLEKSAARQAVINLISLGSTLCISANPSGGGHYHVNPQPRDYWIKLFEKHGVKYQQAESEHLEKKFSNIQCSAWFKENLKVFRK